MPIPVQEDPLLPKTKYSSPISGDPSWTTAAPSTAASGGHSTPVTNVALNDPKPGGVGPSGAVTPGGPMPVQEPPPPPPPPPILAGPGAYEEWIKSHQAELDNPTRTEGLYDSGATSTLDNSPLSGVVNPNSAASYNDWLASHGSVTGAGNSKDVLSSLSTGPSKASDVYTTASGSLSKPGATEKVYGEHGGAFDSTGAGEDWYAKYGGDPMQKSYSENLYEGGIGQLDPAYQYALDKGLQKARTASSARSQFNSTYAGQEERDLIGNLTGQQASKWVDFAPVADAAKRARYDQGEKFAGDDNSQYRQRIQDMFGLAKTNDDETRARLDTLSGIAARGDSADTANAGLRVSAAGNADRSATDIYNAEQGAQKTGSDLTREQGDQNIDLASKQDSANRNNLTTKFGLAGAADSSDLGRFFAQGKLAQDLQNTGQNRVTGALNATTDQATREAKLAQDIYSDTANIDNMDDTALQALADKYGVSLQELNSVKDDAKSVVSLLTQAIKGK